MSGMRAHGPALTWPGPADVFLFYAAAAVLAVLFVFDSPTVGIDRFSKLCRTPLG